MSTGEAICLTEALGIITPTLQNTWGILQHGSKVASGEDPGSPLVMSSGLAAWCTDPPMSKLESHGRIKPGMAL